MSAPAVRPMARPAPGAARRRAVLLGLVAVVAALLPLAAAPPAGAAFSVIVPDVDGPDNFPGANQQRDVTGYEVDPAPAPGTIGVRLTFDVTGVPGANTVDACHLFDADGDGNADLAVCASLGGDPFTTVTVAGYTCTDTRADRCGQPDAPLALSPATTCAVGTVAEVFPGTGDDQPSDAEVTCSIALADLGPAAPALLNSCAYRRRSRARPRATACARRWMRAW